MRLSPLTSTRSRQRTALEDNIWYYKDRIGLPRGPLQLSHLRACWVTGVVDEATLVWGQGLESWYPICNVEGLEVNIKSLDVVVAKVRRRTPLAEAALTRLPPPVGVR